MKKRKQNINKSLNESFFDGMKRKMLISLMLSLVGSLFLVFSFVCFQGAPNEMTALGGFILIGNVMFYWTRIVCKKCDAPLYFIWMTLFLWPFKKYKLTYCPNCGLDFRTQDRS